MPPKRIQLDSITTNTSTADSLTTQNDTLKNDKHLNTPYGDIPKIIPRANEINEDPDLFIINYLSNDDDLKQLVDIASYLYHNYETSGINDNAFECLEFHLKKREKKKGINNDRTGAPVIDRIRTTLKYTMPSLNKIKPGTKECSTYLSNLDICHWSLKLDGVSGMATYVNGILTELNTRGDGLIGGDITNLAPYLNIPQTIDTKCEIFVVRGEFVIEFSKFAKYKSTYANPRAFVSGKINSGFISDGLSDIDFVAYEMVDWDMTIIPKPSEALVILKNKGFIVVEDDVINDPLLFTIMNLYKEKKLTSQYLIDGLVLSMNYARTKVFDKVVKAPTYAMAFKMQLSSKIRSSKIIDVDWSITRHGRYFPVAVYKYVYVDGVRLSRASAHNANHVRTWNMGKGTCVDIIRAGNTIPCLKNIVVDSSIIPIYPITYKWHWQGLDIVLDEIDNNVEVQIRRITHFFKTIKLKQFGPSTSRNMHQNGLTTAEAIIGASIKDLIKIKGIGVKKATNYYNSIHQIMKTISPAKLMSASSVFNVKLGRNLLAVLFRQIPNLLDLSEEDIKNYFKNNKIPGYGAKKIELVAKHIPEFRTYLNSFAKTDIGDLISHHIAKINDLNKNGCNPLIMNKKFVHTGFMDTPEELEDYLIDHQGKFDSKVTKDVTAVICGQIDDITPKMNEAIKLGIPIYTMEEFLSKYNIPIEEDDEEL